MRQNGSLLLAAASMLLGTAEADAQLHFSKPVVDLGEIRSGPTRQHSFSFTNEGSRPLEILEVNRSCGCLAPRLDKRRLEPGESGNLRMEIRTLGQPDGPHAWTAQIRYRDGSILHEAELSIK